METVSKGNRLLPFQEEGVRRMVTMPSVLLADPVGSGKTIQVIETINRTEPGSVLIVCPASLKINWQRELGVWLRTGLDVQVLYSSEPSGFSPKDGTVYVINYDILQRWPSLVKSFVWDVLVVDEAHYCTNAKSIRSKMVYSVRAKRKIFVTATPFANRPVELWPILTYLDPGRWRNWSHYVLRYCAATRVPVITRGGASRMVWRLDGASNLTELGGILRSTVMIRRSKARILSELPPVLEQVIEFPASGRQRKIIAREAEVAEQLEQARSRLMELERSGVQKDDSGYREAIVSLRDIVRARAAELARLRHENALEKVDDVIGHVSAILDQEEKVLVFAHHRDVIERLALGLADHGVVTLTGENTAEERQKAIDMFQNEQFVRVFIGNMRASGVGITLTAARVVVFAEMDWTDVAMEQAVGRAHRIGQMHPVLAQYLVMDGSVDARLARRALEKRLIAKSLFDREDETNNREGGIGNGGIHRGVCGGNV